MSDNTELATQPKREIGMGNKGVALETLEDAYRFSKMVCMSGMAPRGIDTPEKVMICLQSGAEVGLSPWQAIQSIAIINNRPCMWGDAVIGLVRASGLLADTDSWEEGEGESFVSFVMVRRVGDKRDTVRSFGWKDAKSAGLLGKDTYKNYLKRMCFNRARAFALRDVFPDVLKGLSVNEEVQEYQVIDDAPQRPKRVQRSDLLSPAEQPGESPEPEPSADDDPDMEPAADDGGEVPGEPEGLTVFGLTELLGSNADEETIQAEIDNSRQTGMVTAEAADKLEVALKERGAAGGGKLFSDPYADQTAY